MSGLSTKKREMKEAFDLMVGWSVFNVVALNPERDELNKLLGTEKTEDIDYLSEDDNGNAKLRLTFWLEDVKTKWKQSVSFWITEKERLNKAGDSKQWVNQSGKTTWGPDEDNLPVWFKNFMVKEKPSGEQYFRVAYDGEEGFINFMSAWLQTDRKEGTGVLPDYKQLFKGNVKELRGLIGSDIVNTVIVPLGVKKKDLEIVGDDNQPTGEVETKMYQSVFNRAFLPGQLAKNIRIGGGYDSVKKQIANFKKKIEEEHGFKDHFIFQEAKPYDPEKDISSGGEEISETGNDYN